MGPDKRDCGRKEENSKTKRIKGIFGSSLLHGDTVESYDSLSDVATSKDLAKVHIKFEKVKLIWTLSGCLTNHYPQWILHRPDKEIIFNQCCHEL